MSGSCALMKRLISLVVATYAVEFISNKRGELVKRVKIAPNSFQLTAKLVSRVIW